jgi:Arc/MetJ-type ribon-helix-helix transcriptional regulator
MARFMISMPDEMLKKLDEAARKEHRSRSELLREAARRHLSVDSQLSKPGAVKDKWDGKRKGAKKMKKKSMTQRLLELGIGRSGCPGLDRLVGPVKDEVDMRRLVKIGSKLKRLTRDIIDSREDRW